MKLKVAIGPSSFASENKEPVKLLEKSGFEIIPNPFGRRLNEEEIISQIKNADALIAGLEPLNRKVLSSSKLKAISRVGIGVTNIDFEAAKELNIKVSNTPDAPSEAVAEMTITALLALTRQLFTLNSLMHTGKWSKLISSSIKGSKVLIIGYGRIGSRVSKMLQFFNAEILVADPNINSNILNESEKYVTIDEGLKNANIITLHVDGINEILGHSEFEMMKEGVIILNSARGELVNEKAFIEALQNKKVKGAWFDVFIKEPYDGPLTNFENVILTPHVGTYTKQCRINMEMQAVENLLRDLQIN